MTPKEMDDCLYALGQVMAFYGKEMDVIQKGFWKEFFRDKEPDQALKALKQYATQGRYSPKPKDILEIIESYKEQQRTEESYVKVPLPSPKCPEKISRAWRYWLPRFGYSTGWLGNVTATPQEAKAMLLLINQEAKRMDIPTAIPSDFRLSEVWDG